MFEKEIRNRVENIYETPPSARTKTRLHIRVMLEAILKRFPVGIFERSRA